MSIENAKKITYPGFTFKQDYMIDKEGHVYSPWRGWHQMFQHENRCGYQEIMLYTNQQGRKHFKIHRLVLNTFNSRENSEKYQVNHKDGNKKNNSLNNLEWCNKSQNISHAYKNNLMTNEGENNPSHKLTNNKVHEICKKLENHQTLQSIADQYGVTKGTIAHIKQRRSWIHISCNYTF